MSIIFQALGSNALAAALGGTLVPTAFFNILWFIYLSTSERVKSIRARERVCSLNFVSVRHVAAQFVEPDRRL